MKTVDKNLLGQEKYRQGFITDIEQEKFKQGLDESTIRKISLYKKEPEFMLRWRLEAYKKWTSMKQPHWSSVEYEDIDYNSMSYYAAPKKPTAKKLEDVDPKLLETYSKLGIPIDEQKKLQGIAVDAVFDSVSVFTTFKKTLTDAGVIFCPISEAVHKHQKLVKKYLGSVVSQGDNFFSALNASVFSDGSFVYVPPGVHCPMELSTYFRINAQNTGQFERTLIIADKNSYVSYLEGCTAPMRDENQLHAAVVELIALDNAQIRYSTVQNWYPGDENGKGGIYNFVTKRGLCQGKNSKISWTQLETGSAITWKYPSVILKGDRSKGEFYSVALTRYHQQADTGTKMIHIGENTTSTVISKGISMEHSKNSYRGLIKMSPISKKSRNFSQCDSLIIGDKCIAGTYPYIESKNETTQIEHEATTSKISDEQIFYCLQRGIPKEDALTMIVNGFCKDIFAKLPLEFAIEANKLMEVSMEGSIG